MRPDWTGETVHSGIDGGVADTAIGFGGTVSAARQYWRRAMRKPHGPGRSDMEAATLSSSGDTSPTRDRGAAPQGARCLDLTAPARVVFGRSGRASVGSVEWEKLTRISFSLLMLGGWSGSDSGEDGSAGASAAASDGAGTDRAPDTTASASDGPGSDTASDGGATGADS